MSPYEVLGVSVNSSIDEIKSAYRTLAKRYHPDSRGLEANATKFREITEAYRLILSKNGEFNELSGLFISDDLFISVKESIFGIHKKYNIRNYERCDCGALGVKCIKCHGLKYIKKGLTMKVKCTRCNGSGFENSNCYKCHGSGVKTVVESIDININRSLNDGEINIFRYSKGKINLKFIIKKLDSDIYDRSGNDLIYIAKISPLDQIIGTNLLIPRINNESVRLQVRENIDIPSYFKIPNSGIPGTEGNLIVKLIVDTKLMDISLIPKIREAVRNKL